MRFHVASPRLRFSTRLTSLVVGSLLLASSAAIGQVANSERPPAQPLKATPGGTVLQGTNLGPGQSAVIVDFRELARRDRELPPSTAPLEPRRLAHRLVKPLEPVDEASTIGTNAVSIPPPPPTLDIPSPSPSTSFVGLDDIPIGGTSFVVIPPDVDGAVGRTKMLEGLNNNYRVFDKATGTVLNTVSTNTFWAASGGTPNSFFDPKTLYDPINDRWIATMLSDPGTANSSVCIAVSLTDDPEGAWFVYRVDMDAANTLTADFPSIGFNQNWVAINLNMFAISTGTFSVGRCLVMDYAQLRAGTLAGTIFSGTGFCSSPAATYSAIEPTLYVPTHLSSAGGTYRLDRITGTPAAPVYTVGATMSRGLTWVQPGGNLLPQAAPLAGASACGAVPCKLEAIDAQIRSTPVVRDGALYYTQTVANSSVASTQHTMVQWTQLALPAGTVAQGGRIEDPTANATNGGKWYAYGHIAANAAGDVMVGYSQFASNQFPASGYSMRLGTDPINTMRDPLVYKAGEDYYHKTFSTATGRNRWGDYSKVQVDPCDDATLWTVQEYAKLRTGTDDGNTGSNSSKWGTYWAAVGGPAPTVTIADAGSQPEGNGGTTTHSFTVSLSSCYALPVTVQYQTEDGTATVANDDYVAETSSITIPSGSMTGTITIDVNGDLTFEADETFTVRLTGATNGTVGSPDAGSATIGNDDAAPTVSIDDLTDSEGNGGTTTFTFTVSLSNPTDQPVTVDYQTNDGSATLANGDYVAGNGTVTIPAKESSATVTVDVNGDVTNESDETFTVDLSNPTNAALGDGQGTGTITNDDTAPTVSIDDVSMAEGHAGSTSFTFTVSLSNPTDQPVTVDYAANDGSATQANDDYEPASGTVTIAAKTLSATLTVDVNGDVTNESDETFTVDLSNASNGTILDGQGTGTITNDDSAPSVSIDDVSLAEGHAGTTTFTFTVSLSNPSDQPVTVDYLANDGSATQANDDYEPASGTVTIAAKTLSTTLTVDVNGDITNEPDETFTVDLSNATNAAIGDGQGTGTIVNDDDTELPAVTVVLPNGGETHAVKAEVKLEWTATDNVGVTSVDLYLSRSGVAGPYETIALGEPNDGTYTWTATNPPTMQAILKVVAHDAAGNAGEDVSDDVWTIETPTAVLVSLFEAVPEDGGIAVRWQFSGTTHIRSSRVERADRAEGPWGALAAAMTTERGVTTLLDATAEPGRSYWYRIVVDSEEGTLTFGPIRATTSAGTQGPLALAIVPNPSPGATRFDLTLPRESKVRLTVADLQGRVVATVADGTFRAGRHQAAWRGDGANGRVPAGVYFVRVETAAGTIVRRLTIAY
jgi:hypothetical protein